MNCALQAAIAPRFPRYRGRNAPRHVKRTIRRYNHIRAAYLISEHMEHNEYIGARSERGDCKKIANFWRIFRVEFEPPDETGDFSKSPTSEQVTTDSVIIPFLAMGPVDRCQVARVGDDNYRQKVSVLQCP
jgi:hypothetical protein